MEVETHGCRVCGDNFPATVEYFYRQGDRFNWACKSCVVHAMTERRRARHGRVALERTCGHCGTSFVTVENPAKKQPKRFCSVRCQLDHRYARLKRERLEEKPDRWCLHCGCALPKALTMRASFCSLRCNHAAHRLIRRVAGRAGAARQRFYRAQLGERDGWCCQICGKPVDRERRHPDPLAPSVDHLLPLALGGTSDIANLQLAHLGCNIKKRHYVGDLQLRLVG